MLVTLVDAAGAEHLCAWQGQDQVNDFSGSLQAGAVGETPEPQLVSEANPARGGFLFQNNSPNPMYLFEQGSALPAWLIAPGGFFPNIPNYPIPPGSIYVQGYPGGPGVAGVSQIGDTFTFRDWQTAVGE